MGTAKHFFSAAEKQRIEAAIQAAEKDTSGEIQVHIENACHDDVLDRAAALFGILKMHQTARRNGILFYLAVKDKKFAILGDTGIDKKVPDTFWDEIKDHMQQCFREGRFTDGLCDGIRQAGEALSSYFPYQQDDVNELPDDISFGNN